MLEKLNLVGGNTVIPRIICCLALVLLVAACAKPTPYQPEKGGFGYAEQQIEGNRFRVTFRGNYITSLDTVEIYLIYRAAALTVQTDNDYFEVTNRATDKSTRYYSTYNGFAPFGYYRRGFHNRGFGTGFVTGTTRPINEYEASMDILVFQGAKPRGAENAYDARDVLQRLGPRIVWPPPPGG